MINIVFFLVTLTPAQLLRRLSELVPEWMMLGIQLDIQLDVLKYEYPYSLL